MFEPFRNLKAKNIPLPMKDIDTDMIIPAQYLTKTDKFGYGENLFERLRASDPNFPLNLEKFKDGQILTTRSNFGCGSSREHAVWALLQWGIRVVIAPSFADIFFNNAAKNGLVLVRLPEDLVETILAESETGNYYIEVDLESQIVTLPDNSKHHFPFDPFRKECILRGLDDLAYIQSFTSEIEAWHQRRQAKVFYNTLIKNFN